MGKSKEIKILLDVAASKLAQESGSVEKLPYVMVKKGSKAIRIIYPNLDPTILSVFFLRLFTLYDEARKKLIEKVNTRTSEIIQ